MLGEQPESIALVISDLIMPEMRGTELLREIRGVHADLPVLLVSGYTEDAMMRQRTFEPGTTFLEKPFTPDILVRTVREMLDRDER
jgi:DNA-binding NtrC family response regulator